ncbi:DUF721 domain-containing protein [Streptomyces naphthomycinicus]|uniref:DUF721 domain-containing protein n=1 Tax=Streptomyces naphthomycinicus TaxID=2872625 RepID=UPI0021F0D4C3|nr:DUF721 domain-containing protein [Streptomyces sp. TML10]
MVALRQAREDARRHRYSEPATHRTRTPVRRRAGRTEPARLEEVLQALFPQAGTRVLLEWPAVAGEVARHVRAAAFDTDTGALTLAADSKAWLTQARLLTPALTDALNARLTPGTVRSIHLVRRTLHPLPAGLLPPHQSVPPPAPPPTGLLLSLPPAPPDPDVQAALERQHRALPRERPHHTADPEPNTAETSPTPQLRWPGSTRRTRGTTTRGKTE